MTQRKPNPWFVRAAAPRTAEPRHRATPPGPQSKRVAVIADDFAFGHENVAGFQRVFEDAGAGRAELFTPLNAPDYGTYISQLKGDLDAVYTGHCWLEWLQIIKQLREYGLKTQVLGALRRSTSRSSSRWATTRSAPSPAAVFGRTRFPANKKFVENIRRDYKGDPASTPPRPTFRRGLENVLQKIGGKIETRRCS